MDERVFFEQGQVKVTNARFVVAHQTYAMNGVTSVSSYVTPPERKGAIIALLFGLFLLLVLDGGAKLIGLIIAGLAGWALSQMKSTHSVFLSSASGEVKALSDTDERFIGSVVGALNEALVHRG